MDPLPEQQTGTLITRASQYLPRVSHKPCVLAVCTRCRYVNPAEYKFCTNCGYTVSSENSTLYQYRHKQRKELLKKSGMAVQSARVSLYLIAGFFLVTIGFLFGSLANRYALVLGGFTLSALFFLLAKWSLLKPFTALLTALIIVITFCTITVFSEVTSSFTTVPGLYTIAGSIVAIYFLLKGVQGAYQSDLLNEEMEIH